MSPACRGCAVALQVARHEVLGEIVIGDGPARAQHGAQKILAGICEQIIIRGRFLFQPGRGLEAPLADAARPHDKGAIHTYLLRIRPTKLGDLDIPPFVIKWLGETVSTEGLKLDSVKPRTLGFPVPAPQPARKSRARPKVTVIIPSYQHEGFIGRCIDSVLAQSEPRFELIVADDCSEDDISLTAVATQ